MSKQTINLSSLPQKLLAAVSGAQRYSLVAFILFVSILYGFLLFRTVELKSQQPSQSSIDSQLKAAAAPRIDQSVVSKLRSLKDNSVNVQSLFPDSRTNPFQE